MKAVACAIRSVLPSSLRRCIHKIAGFLVADLPPPFPSIERSLETLKQSGFKPAFCIDVGAYTGEWTKMFLSIFPESRVLMLEAQEAKRQFLEKLTETAPGQISLEIALLGPQDGKSVEFSEMETGSSVFAESSSYARSTHNRLTTRLDTIVSNGPYPVAQFLKLDVQGYELEVLKGSSSTLRTADAVLMESSLIPINNGCPTISEVMRFMDDNGFDLFDFCSQIRREDGALWQTDLLFLRRESGFLPKPVL